MENLIPGGGEFLKYLLEEYKEGASPPGQGSPQLHSYKFKIEQINSIIVMYNTMKYNYIINNLSHYGDILAIPFFALIVIYFYKIQEKSLIEYILLGFSISGLIFDILYTYLFLRHSKSSNA